MIRSLYRNISMIALPAAILTGAALALPRLADIRPPWQELLPYLPLLTIFLGLLLSFHFRRGRVFLVLVILAAFYWAARSGIPAGRPDPSAGLVFRLMGLVFPANIVLFSFMRERGVLTTAGRMRLGFLILQSLLIVWLVGRYQGGIADILTGGFALIQLPAGGTLPLPAFILFVLASIITTVRLARRETPVDSAFLAALLAVAVVCAWPATTNLPEVFIAAAALALALGVLQDSHNMAFRDDLTNLPSRRALNEQLMDLGRRYVIAMLDVDHFKSFNDTYGHDVGDQVLKMVAARINAVKGGGRPFRYGGEEFTVIFPRRRLNEAMPYLEEVRKSIAEYRLVIRDSTRPEKATQGRKKRGSGDGETVSVTISIGVAESSDRFTPVEVMNEADQALYRAKRKGRNITSK
ncbi:MAG TPA: GGDEF domain-containing protein [Geobacteraceae bacterium]|nr:GGDEF domain-containing protein [Geobacteraceae bacterium]